LAKLQYQEGVSSVAYRSKISHGKNKKNFQVFSPFEFIVAIAQHIPEPSFQLVGRSRYAADSTTGLTM